MCSTNGACSQHGPELFHSSWVFDGVESESEIALVLQEGWKPWAGIKSRHWIEQLTVCACDPELEVWLVRGAHVVDDESGPEKVLLAWAAFSCDQPNPPTLDSGCRLLCVDGEVVNIKGWVPHFCGFVIDNEICHGKLGTEFGGLKLARRNYIGCCRPEMKGPFGPCPFIGVSAHWPPAIPLALHAQLQQFIPRGRVGLVELDLVLALRQVVGALHVRCTLLVPVVSRGGTTRGQHGSSCQGSGQKQFGLQDRTPFCKELLILCTEMQRQCHWKFDLASIVVTFLSVLVFQVA